MKLFTSIDRCVVCGEYVPEGSMVCAKCQEEMREKHHKAKIGKYEVWEDRRKKAVRRGKVRLEEYEDEV